MARDLGAASAFRFAGFRFAVLRFGAFFFAALRFVALRFGALGLAVFRVDFFFFFRAAMCAMMSHPGRSAKKKGNCPP